MKITGVVCEFNPFHNGHRYLFDSLRKNGTDIIICIMSGSFVQRGECAFADKFTRASCAVGGGADLVFELPFPYCMSGSEFFASAGVYLAGKLGCDSIGFGAENADVQSLYSAAHTVLTDNFINEYKKLCRKGTGSAKAYFDAYHNISGKDFAPGSNNILALAYVKEIIRSESRLTADIIQRCGSPCNSEVIADGTFPSAAALRKNIFREGLKSLHGYIPPETEQTIKDAYARGTATAQMQNIGHDILTFLRICDVGLMDGIADADEGLAERIHAKALVSAGYDELISNVSAPNYTDSRIKRAIINMMLGVGKKDITSRPAYVQLLASDAKGREYLSDTRRNREIPVVTKPADAKMIPGGERQNELCVRAEALWCMTLPHILPSDTLTKMNPVIM